MSDATLDSPPPRRRSLPPPTDPHAPATAGMLHAHAEEDAEDSDAILAGVQRIHKGQRQLEKHLEAGATAQMRQAEIAQARLDAEREARDAARLAAEAEEKARAAWWGRVSDSFDRMTSNRLVQLVVLGLLVALFPSLQRYADAAIGWFGGPAPTAAVASVPAPAESEP